jgi:hypothetical protein
MNIYFVNGGPLEGRKVANPPTNALCRNLGDFRFVDATHQAGVGIPGFGLGAAVADYDNVHLFDDTTSYRARNVVLRNTGDGKFANVSDRAGDGMLTLHSARGAAFDDLDNDGDIDVAILNSREEPTILRNILNKSGPE